MSIQLIGRENLPNIYIKEIELHETRNRYIVRPLLYLYDFRDNREKLQWYEDHSLKHNMKILVVSSVSESFNDAVASGQVIFTPEQLRKAPGYTKELVKYKVIPIASVNKQTFENAENDIYTFPYRCKFSCKKEANLSVFACMFLDTVQFSTENALDLSSERTSVYHGAIVGENVFKDGSLATMTNLFTRRSNGGAYTGPVHAHRNRYMAGSRHSSAPHSRLNLAQVPNAKIKDYRFSYKRKRRSIRYRRQTLIGEMWSSVDRNGNLRATFPFNIEQIMLQKSEYGFLLRKIDEQLFKHLLGKCKVTNLAIYKQQVKEVVSSTKVTNVRKTKLKPTGRAKVLVETKDRSNGVLKAARKYSDNAASGAQIELVNGEQEPNTSLLLEAGAREVEDYLTDDSGIRMITFQDSQPTNSSARYRYFVEMEIRDPTQDYLENLFDEMRTSMSVFKNYKRRVLRKSSYDYHTHQTRAELYNNTSNDMWERFVINFLDIYSMFFSFETPRQELYDRLVLMVHPKTLTDRSINRFETRYKYLFSYFKKYFRVNATDLTPKIKLGRVKADDKKGIIQLQKNFKEAINFGKYRSSVSFIPNSIGYQASEYKDFPTLTHNDIRTIATNERQKYFKDAPTFTPDTVPSVPEALVSSLNNIRYNSYTYFSPAAMTFNKSDTIDLSKIENVDIQKFNKFYYDCLRDSVQSTLYHGSKRAHHKRTGDGSAFYVRRKQRATENQQEYKGADEVLGQDSEFPAAAKEETKVGGSTQNQNVSDRFRSFEQSKAEQAPKMEDYYLQNKENVLMQIANSSRSNSSKHYLIRAIPLQVKALMGSEYGFARNNIFHSSRDLLRDSLTRNFTKTMFLTMAKMQYLDHYDNNDVGRPQWKDMTEYQFSRKVNSGNKTVLCRFVPYDNTSLGLDGAVLEAIGIEDEYFYVSRRLTLPRPPSRTRRYNRFRDYSNEAIENISAVHRPASQGIIIQQPSGKTGVLRSVDFGVDNRTRVAEGDVESVPPPTTGPSTATSTMVATAGGTSSTGGGGGYGGGY